MSHAKVECLLQSRPHGGSAARRVCAWSGRAIECDEKKNVVEAIMKLPILIERITGNGYRARGGEPLPLVAEGATREEALTKLKEQLQARLRDGTELTSVDLAPTTHPLAEFAGMFKDDPMLEEWKQSMAEYRRKVDEDPDIP